MSMVVPCVSRLNSLSLNKLMSTGVARLRPRQQSDAVLQTARLTRCAELDKNLNMESLVRKIESQLAGLPVPVALRLPAGERSGPAAAAVTLSFKDWSSLATMAAGQIGRLAEDFVESRVQLEGRMRDMMAVAAGLLPGHAGEQRHELVGADAAPGQVAGGPYAAEGRAANAVPLRRVRRFLCAVAGPAPRLLLRLLPGPGTCRWPRRRKPSSTISAASSCSRPARNSWTSARAGAAS